MMGYCKLGIAFGRWDFKSHLNTLPAINYSKKRTLPGFKFALGVEGDIINNLAWGVEYNHTFFKSHTLHRPSDVQNEEIPHKIKPNYGALLLRVMYKFK